MSALRFGELAFIAYSRFGHTKMQNNRIQSALDDLENERLIKNSNHAAFVASLQCADELKIVSRGL